MHTIQILNVVHSLDIGGMENGLVNLINRTDPNVFVHDVCCLSHSGRFAKRILRDDCEIFSLDKKEGNDISLPYKLWRALKGKKYDIIHTRNWSTFDAILPGKLLNNSRIVHSEHGTGFSGDIRRRIIARRMLDVCISRYVTVSKSLHDWLCKDVGIKENKIQVISNGVDAERFCPGVSVKRALLSIPSHYTVIGFVGRLDRIKNLPLLITAFSWLLRDFPNLCLLIVGDGPEEPRLRSMVSELGLSEKVRFLGPQNDVVPYLRLMNLFVLPSQLEGMSNTILEAMSVGLSVVAFRVGGNTEIVDHCRTGILVDDQTPEALSKAISFYLKKPDTNSQHGKTGRKRVLNEFSISKMVSGYETLYANLVNGSCS